MSTPAATLRRFGFRQTIKGAAIFGVFVGFLVLVQGFGYAATYPNAIDREKFAATLGSAPSLGILYGEPEGLLTASGYMVYRAVAVVGFIGSIWMMLTITKMLRGSEEDGRLESVVSGQTTLRHTTMQILLGASAALFIGYGIASLFVAIGGLSPILNVSVIDSLFISAAIFLPTFIGAAGASLVSQLTITRRRAAMYGIAALSIAFVLRSIGNVLPDWYWLKNLTPFGWSDQLRPIIDLQPIWFLPLLIAPVALFAAGIFLAGKRDYGASLLHESTHAKSRYYLLGSAWKLALRLNLGVMLSWTLAVVALGAIIASVTTVATDAVADSNNLSQSIIQLTGGNTDKLKLAFIGAGTLFTAMVLLIMATVGMGAIRRDEAKQHTEAVLVQPVGRLKFLIGRLLIVIISISLACLLSNIVIYFVAMSQNISLDASTLIFGNLQMLGAVLFLIGIGTIVYGLLPGFTTISMYLILVWSFAIDMIVAVVSVSDVVKDSSLLHYISFVPAVDPDWKAFGWLAAIGLSLMAIGIWRFTKRDYTSE